MSPLPRSSRIIVSVIVLALLALTAPGCSAARRSADEAATQEYGTVGSTVSPAEPMPGDGVAADEAARSGAVTTEVLADDDRMVVRNKTLRLEVESTQDAIERIRAIAKTHSGTIQDLQVATDTDEWLYRYDEYGYATGDGAALRGWVTVRVPADAFDAFVEEAVKLGEVRFQAEDTEDVTQQHVDLSARLANLRAEEERLRTFFDAAKDVKDMLAIESELNRVRQEVESLDAQVEFLERQAAMATVTIEFTEARPVVRPDGDDWGFRDAVTDGFRAAADVLAFLIALIIGSAPVWIVAIIAFFVIRTMLRARRTKRAAPASTASADLPQEPESPDGHA